MHLWFYNIDNFNDISFYKVLKTYPVEIVEEIDRYLKMEDKKARLISRLLIQKYMLDNFNEWDWKQWHKNNYHKPYVQNKPFFNISHSGKIVVVVFNNSQEVGVDVEEIKEMDITPYFNFFHPLEKKYLTDDITNYNKFYSLWTKKEAFLKTLGIGLLEGMDKYNVLEQPIDKKWYLHEMEFLPAYKCTVCSTLKTNTIMPLFIDKITLENFITQKIFKD